MTALIHRVFKTRPLRLYPHLPRTLRAVLLKHDVPTADTHETADAVEMAALVCDALVENADPSDLYTRALFQQAAKELHQIAAP